MAPPAGRPDPTIDILLATYNGAAYLDEQLASLEAQTHANWHLIARDDGSLIRGAARPAASATMGVQSLSWRGR